MVAVPTLTPLTTPLASIVATAVLDDNHTPPLVASDNVIAEPEHTAVEPVMAATDGTVITDTFAVLEVVPHELFTL